MTSDAGRWERVQELFHAALERPEGERHAFVDAECAGQPDLLREVLALLEEDERDDSLLDSGVALVAHQVMDGSVPMVDRVGTYEIRGVLGRGGMGVVYLGWRQDLQTTAAIKVLRDASLSPARRERFAVEQRTLAQLTHPAIARIYDADVLPDGTPYFVMEHVEGSPVTEYLASNELSLEARLRLFRSVCEAVQVAHSRAVIHRDLKPSNILVTAEGAPKLLDFGIAKQLEGLGPSSRPTETGLRLLTPAYAAPEQVSGEPVGTHTDIYALGVVLYEMLTGRLPFDLSACTPGQAETIILERDPPRPSAVTMEPDTDAPPRISPPLAGKAAWADLDVLCLTAMHKDTDRRYRTVDALIRDVDRFLTGQPLEARPDSTAYRLGKLVRRRWRPLLATGVVAASAIGLVSFYTLRLAAARNEAVVEAARAQRIQAFTLSLFSGGDVDVGPPDSLRVVSLVDRGVREARVLDREPEVQAELYQTLGSVSQQLGDLEQADSLLERSLALRTAHFGPDHPEVARTLVALARLRTDQARLDEAEALIRSGRDRLLRARAPGHPDVLEAETALGKVLQERGSYAAAVEVLERVVETQARLGPSAELSASMGELANTHFYAGDYAASDSLNRVLNQIDRELFGSRHPNVGDGLINLGAIQFQLGRYDEAERLYREALDIFLDYYGPDHPETASNLTMLGRSLVYQGSYDEAVESLSRALDIQERVFGPVHPSVASTLNDLGIAALQEGDLRSAEERFRRMIAIYDEIYDGEHYLLGLAESNLASVHLEAGRLPEAERQFRSAIARFEETLGRDHFQTAVALIKLGRSLARQERWVEAEPVLLSGHDILAQQTSPSVSWLRAARTDLIATYEALGRPEDADRYRAESGDQPTTPPGNR